MDPEDGYEEEGPFSALLPPDDRLWRHPSEMPGHAFVSAPNSSGHHLLEGRSWAIALLAALVGASLATGVGMATGQYHPKTTVRPIVRVVQQPTAVTLVSSSSSANPVALAARVEPFVVTLEIRTSTGEVMASGVVFRSDGSIITDDHLLAGVRSIVVVLADGRRVKAKVVGGDPETDIGVVRFAATKAPVATLDTASSLQPGQMVVAVGTSSSGPVVSSGVVRTLKGALNRTSSDPLLDLIETDAVAAPSASGGALINSSGQVVGITTSALAPSSGPVVTTSATVSPGSSPVSFAVPIATVVDVANQILTLGHVAHSWLGVKGLDTSPALNNKLGISGGALIRTVFTHSPAASAGLRPGDVVTAVGSAAVTSMDDLVAALRPMHSGQRVSLTLFRDGHPRTTVVTLGLEPTPAP